ncbi:hypothetical protein FBZ98_101777 [Rhizobium sp. ERR 922]|uniref:hypothetical protein n=1 Tax=unclassified Rhizobium TaxID=2613769 RepID=UPI00119A90CD|nr:MULTISPECIES: hypothetical protein [unclassified Rhizobium]TWB18089.1 hypothetical protein FBZ99_102678 [Rhizobium sp. ERR1071]TWB61436.1 hypothetical protein FBZ98_101777 [Rhizobium sp. ERR 922]TWC04362.1 hypothetical protein FBZ97_101777 [Rhizobium sp. ERR 942]
MNNIVLFRERRFAAKFSAPNTFAMSAGSRPAERSVPPQRPRLIAIWHINSLTGKLECFWTTEGEPVLDEDGSRHAAYVSFLKQAHRWRRECGAIPTAPWPMTSCFKGL